MGKSALLHAAGRGDTAGVEAALESGADLADADAQVLKSMSLKYEPALEPLHISVK